MNTYMTFTFYGENSEIALQEAADFVKKVEALWSVTDKNSEIYRANHNYGQPVTISKETEDLVSFASVSYTHLDVYKRQYKERHS